VNLVEQVLLTPAGNAAVDGFRPAGSIVLTPRFPDSRHVVVLLLDLRGKVRVVAKIVRAPEDPSTLDQEASVLGALARLAARRPQLARSVPRLLALDWVKGHRVMLQSAVTGRPVTHLDARRRGERWWRITQDWLDELRVEPGAGPGVDWLDSYIGARINLAAVSMRSRTSAFPDLHRAMGLTATLALELRSAAPFAVVEHGDLSHPNVLASKSGLSVVDWETGHAEGLIGVDAAVFLTFLEFARASAHGVEKEVAVYAETMLDPAGPARARLARHLADRDVNPEFIDHVLAVAWGRVALGVFPRLLAGPQSLNLAAEARAAQLFTESRPFQLWMMSLNRSLRFNRAAGRG
jgi:aminoglycoside phosphotransferase